MADRIRNVVQACFNGRRIVVFSGGAAKDLEGLYDEARGIRDGGGNGSIIGRNTFQRPRERGAEDARPVDQDLSGQGVTAIASPEPCRLYLTTPPDQLIKIYQGKE